MIRHGQVPFLDGRQMQQVSVAKAAGDDRKGEVVLVSRDYPDAQDEGDDTALVYVNRRNRDVALIAPDPRPACIFTLEKSRVGGRE